MAINGLDAPNGAIAYANATAMGPIGLTLKDFNKEGTDGGRDSGPPDGRGIAANKLIREP